MWVRSGHETSVPYVELLKRSFRIKELVKWWSHHRVSTVRRMPLLERYKPEPTQESFSVHLMNAAAQREMFMKRKNFYAA
jgi:hypothetical protein